MTRDTKATRIGDKKNFIIQKDKTCKQKTAKLAAENATKQESFKGCQMIVRRKSGKAERYGGIFFVASLAKGKKWTTPVLKSLQLC